MSDSDMALVVKRKRPTAAEKQAKVQQAELKQAQRSAHLLKSISDPTRLSVVGMLAQGERHVSDLCANLHQSQPAVSHHLALLRHGGIIEPHRQGKNNYYALTERGWTLAKVISALEHGA